VSIARPFHARGQPLMHSPSTLAKAMNLETNRSGGGGLWTDGRGVVVILKPGASTFGMRRAMLTILKVEPLKYQAARPSQEELDAILEGRHPGGAARFDMGLVHVSVREARQ
jgi:hypothetical protein